MSAETDGAEPYVSEIDKATARLFGNRDEAWGRAMVATTIDHLFELTQNDGTRIFIRLLLLGGAAGRLASRVQRACRPVLLGWIVGTASDSGRYDCRCQGAERSDAGAQRMTGPIFVCHGCTAMLDSARALPFACPNANREQDDIDHVLVAPEDGGPIDETQVDPFLRYRALLSPYRLGRSVGLSDAVWADIVGTLEDRLVATDGRAFRMTPMTQQPALAKALGMSGSLSVKDETGNVAGSHKGRHLMGVMLYLRIIEAGKLHIADGLRARRLAVASCGNAAVAAAIIARAAAWPLDVYIPRDASDAVVRRLRDLGATITICDRRSDETADPCVRSFRHAVSIGAIPFSVQGPDNGLAIEAARALGLEMAEGFVSAGATPDTLFAQVGGGALASALAQGLTLASKVLPLQRRPRLMLVQTEGCAPLAHAWQRLSGLDLGVAVRRRSRFMWPWASAPKSVASGILDDETYDWWEAAKGTRESDGDVLVVDEATIVRAHELANSLTAIRVSTTGAAGLAGLLAAPSASAAIIFSGRDT
jgi:threonine synthase